MVDNVNPTSQFHPYQPETSTPQAERSGMSATGGLGGILGKLGIDPGKLGGLADTWRNTDVRGGMNRGLGSVRAKAQANPGLVLGGLAALAIGAGLMRKRSMAGR